MKQRVCKISVNIAVLLAASPLFAAGDGDHGFDVVTFIAQILNFAVFFGGLFYLIGKPVKEFFVSRAGNIRESLAVAEKSREEAKQRLDEIEEKMARLDGELADIEARAKKDAEKERIRRHEQAEEEAAKIIGQASAEMENLRRGAITELKTYVATLALEEAERIVRDSLTEKERKELFADFSGRLGVKS